MMGKLWVANQKLVFCMLNTVVYFYFYFSLNMFNALGHRESLIAKRLMIQTS